MITDLAAFEGPFCSPLACLSLSLCPSIFHTYSSLKYSSLARRATRRTGRCVPALLCAL
jgi:hypothetical protein